MIPRLRRLILALLFAAMFLSYVDRQALSVAAPLLRDELGISNFGYARIVFAFMLAYTVMQAVTGWVVDRLGTRAGYALLVTWWSVAGLLHAFGEGVLSFSAYRFLLGAAQAGSFAASVRAVAEWFPKDARGFAIGVWGAGTAAGLIGAVPIVAWLTLALGWRLAFVITGASGFLWVAAWLLVYRAPTDHPWMTPADRAAVQAATMGEPAAGRLSYRELLRLRRTWALVLARVFADPIMWFYNAWVPEFLVRTAGFSMADVARYAWIPFLANGAGILAGGALSDRLCRRGWPVVRARVATMALGALLMIGGVAAALPVHVAVAIAAISVAVFGFGLWAPNMMALGADAFPPHLVASVTGLTGVGAGAGGMAFTLAAGWMLDAFGYAPAFVAAGLLPLVALAVVLSLFDPLRRPPSRTS